MFENNKVRLPLICLWSMLVLTVACTKYDKSLPEGKGRLEITLLNGESGQPIPGKWLFFNGDDPVDLQLTSTGNLAIRKHTIYTLTGRDTIIIPMGEYEIWAGRGMEYSIAKKSITIRDQEHATLTLKIKRSVDTEGFVSGDMHLHTVTHSGHGDSNMEERIISCIGEGLEWAVATDHNHVVDYDTVITAFATEQYISSTVGNEVSSQFGHFNNFPVPKGSAPVEIDSADANKLFKQIRAETDSSVIQVNHPRWEGIDYFTVMDFDEHLAETENKNWSWDFDAIEILNENAGWGWVATSQNPYSVRQDWYNILNSGQRVTGVGNSDSHTVEKLLAGMPRNYIASPTDDPSLIDEKTLSQNINKGRVSVAQGLYVQMWVNGVQHRSDTTLTGGEIAVRVKVQAPEWIDCDSVQIIGNGKILRRFPAHPAKNGVKFDKTISMKISEDTWLIAVATGDESMAPMIHDAPDPITPLGFTNPVWVDADEDGQFVSLKKRANRLVVEYQDGVQSLASALTTQTQMIPFVTGALAKRKPAEAMALIAELLPGLDSDLTLFMIRQLGKLDLVEGDRLLEKIEKGTTDPLIRSAVLLALDAEEKNGLSAKQLKKLHNHFRLFDEGDKKLTTYILESISEKDKQLKEILSAQITNGGSDKKISFETEEYSWKEDEFLIGGYYQFSNSEANYIMVEFWSQNVGDLPFIIESDGPHFGWVNGSLYFNRSEGTESRFGRGKISIPVQVGKNQLIVGVKGKPSNFFLVPLDSNRWLNPELANKEIEPHLGLDIVPEIEFPYAEKYRGGENALTDGYRASTQYSDGFWMGFEEKDMVLEFDLESPTLISQISAGFLQDFKAWIWLPDEMEIWISEEGYEYEFAGKWTNTISDQKSPAFLHEAIVDIEPSSVHKIKIIANNMGICPEWHQGAGGKAWLFCDEIKFK